MQRTDKAIAEFEAWWDRQPHREQFEDLKQQFCNVAVAFYQKGREGVVVELPSAEDYAAANERSYSEGIADCRAAIEAAGVTVRG
jgi:hypothetical protein